jgi:hypothetical protein
MFDVFGFGRPLGYKPLLALPGVQAQTWAPPVRMVADALGVELDEIRETYDRRVTPRRLDVASGTIEAGTGYPLRPCRQARLALPGGSAKAPGMSGGVSWRRSGRRWCRRVRRCR